MSFGKTPADWQLQRTLLAALPRSSVLAGALRPQGDEDVLLLWIDWRLHRAMAPGDASRWVADLVTSHRSSSGRGVSALINDWPQGAALPDRWVLAFALLVRHQILRAQSSASPCRRRKWCRSARCRISSGSRSAMSEAAMKRVRNLSTRGPRPG
jgi:hypothetical protein